jgi:putative glutamine amidotransferase
MPPLIGLPADYVRSDYSYHKVHDVYVGAIIGMGAVPVLIPALGNRLDINGMLGRIDGLMLPGSPSNVSPDLYGRRQEMDEPCDDPERDATTLPLIRAALERGMPLFGICRGFQELNVALGGTLHQQLDRLGDRGRHWLLDCTVEEEFALSHEVMLAEGGLLRRWLGSDRVMVNSSHNQGIDRLADGLRLEALADDGTIEAASLPASPGFVCAVQWHPEYHHDTDPVSAVLFRQFGEAVREYARG